MSVITHKPQRPLLRYPGGKWALAGWILEHCPPHRTYVELFAGAGSVLLQKPRAYAEVLNDLNGDLVLLFQVLRDPGQAARLEELLRLTPYARGEYEAAYLPTNDPLERIRRLMIRSWQGFNGEGCLGHKNGWRRPSDHRGTLPAHDWARLPDAMAAWTARLQGVIIECQDALTVGPLYDSAETLYYVDPPYDTEVCPQFQGYPYTVEHGALATMLHRLQGMVVLSGYHSPQYEALYPDWICVERRAYAGTGKHGARVRQECLWLNPSTVANLRQLPLFA